jgi:hypothetical protein
MENEQNRTEADEQQQAGESTEEFVQEVENDPATASSGEDELEQVRGG